ncbi:MAG: hypothetical protein KAR00_00970 [Candidatus Pacebacteria bacterium]|nr:hypothetical protein [Candidatus Paceibacterota bacterium]
MNNTLSKIIEKDYVFGKICSEAEYSYQYGNYFAGLVCLFIISEQIIKHSVDKNNGNFYQATTDVKERNLINEVELELVNTLREFRNKIFQENHYSMFIKINRTEFPISEDETKKLLYNSFAGRLFDLILKLI